MNRRPPLWAQLSVVAGNAAQFGGLLGGAVLLVLAARLSGAAGLRVLLMIVGFLAIYICCHASAHWLIGRLAGIRFRAYGVRGTDHPETYPPGFRQLMSVMPFFTAMTERASMQRASPGGNILFFVIVVFSVVATVTTAITPRGDYTKARRALRTS